jgi:integrase
MRGCEVKNLRWSDVDLLDRVIIICTSKTEAGERTIPIDAEAWSAIGELRERAQLFGGTELRNFLFPACEHGRVDPTRPLRAGVLLGGS